MRAKTDFLFFLVCSLSVISVTLAAPNAGEEDEEASNLERNNGGGGGVRRQMKTRSWFGPVEAGTECSLESKPQEMELRTDGLKDLCRGVSARRADRKNGNG